MKAEEIRDASRVLPLGIMSTVLLNGLTDFIIFLALWFYIGNLEDAVNSPTGQSYIHVFFSVTDSYAKPQP